MTVRNGQYSHLLNLAELFITQFFQLCTTAVQVRLDQISRIVDESGSNVTLTVLKEGTNRRPFTVTIVTRPVEAQGDYQLA